MNKTHSKMKLRAYTLIISAIVLLSSFNFGPGKSQDGVVFYSGTYDNLLREARKQNKPVILDFWASWCGPCRQSFPFMNDLTAKYEEQGLIVLSINVDEVAADVGRGVQGQAEVAVFWV